MSFSSLLNTTAVIKKWTAGSVNEFGESKNVLQIIASEVRVRVQPISAKEEQEEFGEVTNADVVIFASINAPVKNNYEIWVNSDRYKIIKPHDAGGQGHHLEILADEIQHTDDEND